MAIMLLGAQGQLGWELGASLSTMGRVYHYGRGQADLTRLDDLEKLLRKVSPRIIVNAAAHTQVDKAEAEPELAHLINAKAPALLAQVAKDLGCWLVHYSTDYVYNGQKDGPYVEDDPTGPLNVYGASKLAGDEAIMASGCRYLIFRTSWVFAQHGRNFAKTILELAKREDGFPVVDDQFGSPTSVELISSATALALCQALNNENDLSGLYNLVSSGYVNWRDYAAYVVGKAIELGWSLKTKPETIGSRSTDQSGRAALRPSNSRLSTSKFQKTFHLYPPPWQFYVDRVLWAWTRAQGAAPSAEPKILGRRFIPPMNVLPDNSRL